MVSPEAEQLLRLEQLRRRINSEARRSVLQIVVRSLLVGASISPGVGGPLAAFPPSGRLRTAAPRPDAAPGPPGGALACSVRSRGRSPPLTAPPERR
jgi:hypothetical protein